MSKIHSVGLPEEQYVKLRQGAHDQNRTRQECLAEAVDQWASGPAVTHRLRFALDGISSDRRAEDMLDEIERAWAGPPETTAEARKRCHAELEEDRELAGQARIALDGRIAKLEARDRKAGIR